jgi:DNA invertase Pin-like site-specific DNA recombinase
LSIPAQREANRRRALEMGALIVAEFIERGCSGRSLERPELQRMLRYIQDTLVDFVIVHKIDRLARNRADDAAITKTILETGAHLVSTTEAISTTPSGRLLHGIMASIAEFYSQNLATEVTKGWGTLTSATSRTAARSAPSPSTPTADHTSRGHSAPTPPASGAWTKSPPSSMPAG